MLLPKRRTTPKVAAALALSVAVIAPLGVGAASAQAVSPTSVYATGFATPAGLAVDATGNVYVSDYAASVVTKVSLVYGVPTFTQLGNGFRSPLGVAVDAANNVYVADYLNGRVEKITSAGIQTDVGAHFTNPAAVAVDATGDMFVADVHDIVKVTRAGVQSTIASGFTFAKGLAVDAAGDVFVSDSRIDSATNVSVGSVYRVDHASRAVTQVATGFAGPEGLTIDPAGNVLVADTYANRVFRLTPGSTPTVVISDAYYPMAVAVNSAGQILTGSLGDLGLKTGKLVATVSAAIPAPAVAMTALSAQQLRSDVPLSWAVNSMANVAAVDVRYRTSVGGAALSAYTPLVTGTHARTSTFSGGSDTRYCFSAMTRTSRGVASSWSAETCTTIPMDDRALLRSSANSWVSTVNAGWLGSTGSTATIKGSSLTTTKVRLMTSLSLVAWTCPTCGSVDVYVGAAKVGAVSLAKPGAAQRSLLGSIRFSPRTGKVKIVVTSTGKRVSVDGIAIS